MKLLNRLINLVVFMLLLAVGVALLGAVFSNQWWAVAVNLVEQAGRFQAASWGVASVCLAMLFALTGVKKKRKERILSFRNEEGRVSISTQAIAEYICKLSSEFPSIIRMQPRVEPRGKMIDVIVDLRVKAGPQLHEVCEVLQRRVRETMANGLGISDVRRVEINVREISSEHKED